MNGYRVDGPDGEIANGIRSLPRARARAQEVANRTGRPAFVARDVLCTENHSGSRPPCPVCGCLAVYPEEKPRPALDPTVSRPCRHCGEPTPPRAFCRSAALYCTTCVLRFDRNRERGVRHRSASCPDCLARSGKVAQ